MKLASLKDGRDGRLVVVSRDLTRCADASAVAPTLQAALDDWDAALPRLTEIADSLEANRIAHMPFDPAKCASPLPRAYQWLDGSAYVNHVALVRQARGAEVPESFWTDPLMYQGISDIVMGPREPIALADEAWGIDIEAEVVVILGDRADGRDPRTGGEGDQADHAGQRRDAAQHHRRPNSPRASASCSRSRRRPSRRLRSRRTNSARPGTAPRSICRCSASSTASRSESRSARWT